MSRKPVLRFAARLGRPLSKRQSQPAYCPTRSASSARFWAGSLPFRFGAQRLGWRLLGTRLLSRPRAATPGKRRCVSVVFHEAEFARSRHGGAGFCVSLASQVRPKHGPHSRALSHCISIEQIALRQFLLTAISAGKSRRRVTYPRPSLTQTIGITYFMAYKMEAAGIAPAVPVHQIVLTIASAKTTEASGTETGRNREKTTPDLDEMVILWPSLPSPIVPATPPLVRSENQPRRVSGRPKACTYPL